MQGDIVSYLIKNFSPDAILLHGSRARGRERPQSDWDFVLVYKEDTEVQSGRRLFKEQNIEFSVVVLPVKNIHKVFGTKLQVAQVLYERLDEGKVLLKQAKEFYGQEVHWSHEKMEGHRLWTQGRIDGMRDSINNPIIFDKYYRDFSGRVFNYWYWILNNTHSQPVYVADEEIEQKDLDYYNLFVDLINEQSLGKKVEISEKIFARLFD